MNKIGLFFLPLVFSTLSFAPNQERTSIVPKRTGGIISNVKKVEANAWAIYQEDVYPLTNMFDDSRNTFAWLYNPSNGTSYIEIEFENSVVLDDLYIYFTDSSTDWLSSGTFYYSNDTEHSAAEREYTLIDTFTISSKEDIYVRAYGYEAKFIKLVGNTSYNNSWVQISEIGYNSGHFASDLIESVSMSWNEGGAIRYFESNYYSINHMFDDSDNTYTRFYRPNNNDYLVINLKQQTSISSVRLRFFEDDTNERIATGTIQYSADGNAFSDFDTLTTYVGDNYNAQYVDVRDNPVNAQYIRLLITNYIGFVKIADFSINTIPEDYYKVSAVGPTSVYQGCITSMLDGSSSTHTWFNSNVSHIVVDLRKIYSLDSISLGTGKINNGGDFMEGDILCSADGVNYTSVSSYYGELVSNYSLGGVKARYIKLTNSRTGWSAIRVFELTKSSTKYVTQNGLVGLSYNNDLDVLVDEDLDFTYWADWHFASNSYVQVEYTEPVEADNVVFLQQGYTRNIYGTSEVGITYDTFPSCKLSWSLDGESWTDVANYSDSDVNIVYVFSSPVTLKYIRMTYTGNDLSGTGFAAREFDVNFEKHDISASFISNPNLNESYQGYERLPYGLDMTVSYKNLRTGAESTSVPTAISKYKVTLSSVGNSIYNPVNVETTMTVQDSASNLKVDFEALLNNGSICSALNSDELDEIIYRYENCLSTDELDLLAVMEFENSDGDQMLVVDALNYAIARIEANKNSLNNIFANDSANNAASIAVIASISVVILGVAFLYLKVKKSKE